MSTLALTMPEAAKNAGISRAQLYNFIKEGNGPKVTKLNRRSVILTEDLQEWLRSMRDYANKKSNTKKQ